MIMITFAWLWMLPIFSPIIRQQQTQQQRSTHKNEEKRFGLVLRLHSHRPLIILQWSKCNSLASLIAGPGWNGSEYLSNWQKCHFWFGEMPLKLEKKEIMFHSGSPPQLVQLRCNLAYSDSWIIFCCHFWHSLFFHINFFSTCIWDCPKNWRQRKSHTQRERVRKEFRADGVTQHLRELNIHSVCNGEISATMKRGDAFDAIHFDHIVVLDFNYSNIQYVWICVWISR